MKSRIIDAAMELYLENGYDSLTIRNIAEKIEFSPATIYLYFKDKDEIFFSLYNIAFGKFYEKQLEFETIAAPLERINKLGHHYINWGLENPKLYDLMFILDIPMNVIIEGNCVDCGRNTYELLKKTVAECIAQGRLKVKDADLASMMFWNMVHGVVSLLIKKRILYPQEVIKPMTSAIIDNFILLMKK